MAIFFSSAAKGFVDFVDCRQNVRWHTCCQHKEILRKQFGKPSMNILEHQVYIVSADIVEHVTELAGLNTVTRCRFEVPN